MEHPAPLPECLDVYQLEHNFYPGLLHLTEQFLSKPEEAPEPFCDAVHTLSHGLFQLVLHLFEEHPEGKPAPIPANAICFPVRSYGHCYGMLYLVSPALLPANIPMNIGCSIAASCGLCLRLLEAAAFFQQRVKRIDYHIPEKLTRQRRRVLALICQGYSDEEIAGELSIASSTANKHRQTIYQILNVHSSEEVAFVAFRHRLFSPLGLDLVEQPERIPRTRIKEEVSKITSSFIRVRGIRSGL